MSARAANTVLAVTDEARRRLNERGVGVGRTTVVMNSPDEEVFGPPRHPVRLPAEGPVRVVYHGGTAARFGVESLVSGVGLLGDGLPRIILDVYGSQDDVSLRALAREVGAGRVRLAERPTPFLEIPARLAAAHIGVVPTLRDGFTELLLPVKLLEYVHMGLAVVCSRLPVVEQYFSDDELLFYEPGSARDLAAALAEVCGNPEGAHRRAARASERLRELSWDRSQAVYRSLIDELAGAPA
jgi:glycosyltransferase involved in cell wall biosynthesis